MKRITVFLVLVCLVLTSCSSSYSTYRYNFFTFDDREYANSVFEKVIEAMETQDKEALKSLFSEKALNETENIDEKIDELFEFYHGEMLSFDDGGGPRYTGGNNPDGRGFETEELLSMYDIVTSEKQYHMAIREYIEDTEFPDNVGIYAIYIVETDNADEPRANWMTAQAVEIYGIVLKQIDE